MQGQLPHKGRDVGFAFSPAGGDNVGGMAKRKGKSGQRIKDWHAKYVAGDEDGSAHASRQKLTRRAVKLPPRQLATGMEDLDDLPRCRGMVVGMFPGGVQVHTDLAVMLCMVAKTFRAAEDTTALAIGDIVTVAMAQADHTNGAHDDRDRADGMILFRQPRKTALARPQPRSGKRRDRYKADVFEKVIAANMDVLLIVASCGQPPLRPGLIERYRIVAERGELTPLLTINKIDLGRPQPQVLEDFSALGLQTVLVSARSGEGLDALLPSLRGKRSILAGASGVGKSSLINRLVPTANLPTRTVRPADQRGRHTTSSASIYELPGGGTLVDTPGIRELALPIDPAELPWYFPEFEHFATRCKFNNCTHTHEPACAVAAAVEAGKIPSRRFRSYLRLRETLEED